MTGHWWYRFTHSRHVAPLVASKQAKVILGAGLCSLVLAFAVAYSTTRDDRAERVLAVPGSTTTAAEPSFADGTSTSASLADPTASGAPTSQLTTPTPPATVAPTGCRASDELSALPMRAKLAQLIYVGVPDLASAQSALSGAAPAGGVILIGKGKDWFAQGRLAAVAKGARVQPVVAADEEGGRVQRIDAVAGPMPSARTMRTTMTTEQVRALGEKRGRALLSHGISMDLAPVVDLYEAGNAVINDRAFDADPAVVVAYARAFAEGLQRAGVTPVLKHFPGHGRSSGDSHKQQVSTPPLSSLKQKDLIPYAQLMPAIPQVMMGHLDVPGLTDPGVPTSVSAKAINGLLRGDYKFGGLVLTDDLTGMVAITSRFSLDQAVIAALNAGADVALASFTSAGAFTTLLDRMEAAVASGKLPKARVDSALQRAASVKPGRRC